MMPPPPCSDRTSFSSCYLLVPDTAISARNWKLDTEGAPPHKRERDGKWAHPCDMVKHCLDAALHSGTDGRVGDKGWGTKGAEGGVCVCFESVKCCESQTPS